MNVLIIHASPRRKGVTSTLLSEIETAIAPVHERETIRIHDLNMKPCIGCMKCRPEGTLSQEGKADCRINLTIGQKREDLAPNESPQARPIAAPDFWVTCNK
jgi:multimeric flavodoxin WrbA